MLFCLISSEFDFQGEIEIICALFDKGLSCFHLRKPKKTKNELGLFLNKIPLKYHKNITLHSSFELVKKYQIGGIHSSTNRHKSIDSRLLSNLRKSMSAHAFEELDEVVIQQSDYVFMSPIYDSISKKDYQSSFQNKNKLSLQIQEYHQKYPSLKIVALGGVNKNNILELKFMGFDGIAVLGAVWSDAKGVSQSTIINRYNSLIDYCL